MNAGEYAQEIVLPTVREFKASPRSRRHAYLSCLVLYHVKDYLEKAGEPSVAQKMLSAPNSHFGEVRAICNGTKHPLPKGRFQFQAGDDFDRPPGRAAEMQCGISRSGDAVGGREIGQNPIERVDIYEACKATLIAFCTLFPNHLGNCDLSGL
jgi:hypothetical protein